MFGRKRKDGTVKPKAGDVRIFVEQDTSINFIAKVQRLGWYMGELLCWEDLPDERTLTDGDTIVNYFEGKTAAEACAAAQYHLDTYIVRQAWKGQAFACVTYRAGD